jgi:hypothetical protein
MLNRKGSGRKRQLSVLPIFPASALKNIRLHERNLIFTVITNQVACTKFSILWTYTY